MSLLPALVTSLVLAGSPAMRYSSSLRAETFVRTENLTEQARTPVLADFVITPRGQVIWYSSRMELKTILEPQLLLRRTFSRPALEVLTFLFLRGEYRAAPSLVAVRMSSRPFITNAGEPLIESRMRFWLRPDSR